jgi:hypothetical protein
MISPPLGEILAHRKQVINFTLDDNDDNGGNDDIIEVSWRRITRMARHHSNLTDCFQLKL